MTKHLRVARRMARDRNIPTWLRALLIFGVLPIPGPVDNVALIVGVAILWIAHRDLIRGHYAYEASMTAIIPTDTWGAWA